MKLLIYNANEILTCTPFNKHFKRKEELNELNILNNYSIISEDGIITDLTNKITSDDFRNFDVVIDASGYSVLPGLIDPHTHYVFAGNRAKEFELRCKGISYEEISKLGGGINTTVEATRQASLEELKKITLERIEEAISFGITTIEIKSGYGLNLESELKLLKVINSVNDFGKVTCLSTFLGAHTIPKEFSKARELYVDLIIKEMLPVVVNQNLAEACDIFIEKSAFDLDEAEKILRRAKELGLKLKIHCDQFNSIGGVKLGIKLNVISLDHLEVITDEDIDYLSKTDIPAVLLPGVSYFLGIPYAPARRLIGKGIITCIATDFNPGSCMTQNLPLIMNIACTQMGMTINETINSATINPAYALNIEDKVGSIEIGKQADLLILNSPSYQNLVYNFGKNHTKYTIKKGKIVYARNN